MQKFLGAIPLWVKTDSVFFNKMKFKTSKDSTQTERHHRFEECALESNTARFVARPHHLISCHFGGKCFKTF